MPSLHFIGWHRPAIELVAAKLEALHAHNPEQFRKATVVVPTAESGRRLREYMAERAGRPILMPRITLAGQLIPSDGSGIATEAETLAAWLEVLSADGADPVARYAPLIPRRPAAHRERWVVGVAHKLLSLRARLEQEEITYDDVTGLLRKQEADIETKLSQLKESTGAYNNALRTRKAVLANEQRRWSKLGELFHRVDETIRAAAGAPILTQEEARAQEVNHPTRRGHSNLIILACVPELSPQLERYLCNLHQQGTCTVEIWINAPTSEKENFDRIGRPKEEAWTSRDIDIPQALVFLDKECTQVDDNASTIHLVNDAAAVASTAVQLSDGLSSHDIVLATGNTDYTPALVGAFERSDEQQAWHFNTPEGRTLLTTDIGQLAEQLADYCTARLDFCNNDTTEGGMSELQTFVTLLNNLALQQALHASSDISANLQQHIEKLREVLLPATVRSLCSILNPSHKLPTKDYRELEYLDKERQAAYYQYVEKVATFAKNCCHADTLSVQLRKLADALLHTYASSPLRKSTQKICRIIHGVTAPAFTSRVKNALTLLEVLRHKIQEIAPGMQPENVRAETECDILGWRELTYTRGRRVIIAAAHDGCLPEPVQEDEFLPQSLCDELGIRHEPFRHARDSFLLTSLLQSRVAGEVHFIIARQNPDGSGTAPSSLLLRCGEQLPQRARILFAEASNAEPSPSIPLSPLRQAAPGPEIDGRIEPGMMENIRQLAPEITNPFSLSNHKSYKKSFSPSSLGGFLQCPLSFWLKHLFGLDAGNVYDEEKSELESNEYGTLIHAILEHVVKKLPTETALREEFPQAINAPQLTEALLQYVKKEVFKEWCKVYMPSQSRGTQPLPMEIQLCNIEQSLHDFAARHVEDLLSGWENIACEYSLEPTITLSNGETAQFKMIADRIDRHRSGAWRIIDYKTSSGDKKPFKVHFDELEEGEQSPFYRFMNAAGYSFPLVAAEFKTSKGEVSHKHYRWKDVQLMLYAYGLRQLKARDINPALEDTPLSHVMPDLIYYNLQSKTQSMQCYPLLLNGSLEPPPGRKKGYFLLSPEELLANAMQTVDSAIRMIRDGNCLFSAESLRYKTRPFSRLTGDSWDANAPRFGALSAKCDPRSMFNLPELNI